MAIVDLDAHIRAWMVDRCKNRFGSDREIKIIKLDYNNVKFNSQINYQLDQFNPNEQMDTIDQLEQYNRTSLVQQMQITRSETVTNSYTWSAEHGFSVGVSVSASFKVPFIGGIDTTVETEYSFNSTESQTEERSRTWAFVQTVNVPPYSRIIALLMIQKTKPSIPFTLSCSMEGNLRVEADIYKNGIKELWYFVEPTIAGIIADKPLANFSWNGYVAYFKTSGVFQASEGIKALIDLEEFPLARETSSEDSNEQPTKRWTIPATSEEELVVGETFYVEQSVNADK